MRMVSDAANIVTASRSYLQEPDTYISQFRRVHVKSEWDPLKAVLVSFNPQWVDWPDSNSSFLQSLYSLLAKQDITLERKLVDQHGKLLDLLHEKGVKLFAVTPDTKTDAILKYPPHGNRKGISPWTRDFVFAINSSLFQSPGGRTFVRRYCPIFKRDNDVHPHEQNFPKISYWFSEADKWLNNDEKRPSYYLCGQVDGGDVKVLDQGNLVLVGTGRKSNSLGFNELKSVLKAQGVSQVHEIPHQALHLDCCFAPLPNGEALYDSFTLPNFSKNLLHKFFPKQTALDTEEAKVFLASNVLWLNPQEVISNSKAVKTNSFLRERGFSVKALDYDEMLKGHGSFHCTVAPLIREG